MASARQHSGAGPVLGHSGMASELGSVSRSVLAKADHNPAMSSVQVKKVVAVCFLEAAKMTLEHLAEYRLTISQQGVQNLPDLPRIYGEARRLRDYLQRCVSAFHDLVELDFADSDRALLVACCRRFVEAIDLRLVGDQILPADERTLLQRKRTVISDWAVEFADKPPLLELPLPRLGPVQTEGARALVSRLHQKLFPKHEVRFDSHGAVSQTMGVQVPSILDDYAPPLPMDESAVPPPPTASKPAIARLPVEEDVVGPPILDSHKLRDPRLRTLARLDLLSYERSLAGQDHRLAAVLLGSILESAVLDHAIPRRAELGLVGTPDTWNPVDVLAKVMGEQFNPKDRSLAYHAFSARNLLRPSLQIVTPMVVTQASLQRLQEFAQRALHAMGYCATAASEDEKLPSMLRQEGRRIGRPMPD